jgi:hypothetical protein
MRLFLSYARVDKPYCIQIANVLSIHDIWLDDRLYAGQRWWQEIMRRLDWCEGFVYLLSPDSVESEYCRKEYELARQKGKHIFPVLIQPDCVLPDDLRDVHYADLSSGLTGDGVSVLLNAIHLAERSSTVTGKPRQPQPPQRKPTAPSEPMTPPADPMAVIGRAADAMEAGRFDEAVFMLKRAIEHGLRSRFIDIEALLREAEAHLDRQSRQREMEREYNYIAELVKRRRTRKLGCDAFKAFQRDYPDFDPENIAEVCASEQIAVVADSTPAQARQIRQRIPLLEWCEVPSGIVPVLNGKNGHTTRDTLFVEGYYISKYPVTNAQFQLFLNDPQGYLNPRWWDFSPFARAWRMENVHPLASQFQGEERPRDNVTWYEAMAFCNWLSEKIGVRVCLPTRQQWQRAAKGNDNRVYPWGNHFDTSVCNTRESRIRQTTLVMRYDQGVSPFGVYDMAGNVWEWCLNGAYEDCDTATNASRAVQGGSYISAHERAQNNFNFILSPEYHYGSIGFRLACYGR